MLTNVSGSQYYSWPVSTVHCDGSSLSLLLFFLFFPHFILFFYTPLFIHSSLSHSQLLQSLIRSLFHAPATYSLQTQQVSNPIVSVPHACKDGSQQRQKEGRVDDDWFPYPAVAIIPTRPSSPLSCLLVVLHWMPYLN
ncbi:hypothetical protein GGI43DRAFT_171764 [Trichoderma evansii]